MAGLFHSRSIKNRGRPQNGGITRSGMRVPPFDDLKWPPAAFLRSLPILSVTKLGVSAWRFTWAADIGPYVIYLNGEVVDTITGTQWEADLLAFPNFPPPIEIIGANGSEALIDNLLHPPFAQIQWYGDLTATNYYVEEKTGSAAYTRRQIVNENGQGYHLFRTPALPEGLNEWRVIPVDISGNGGTAVDFIFSIVPPPLPPEAVPIVFSGGSIVVGP